MKYKGFSSKGGSSDHSVVKIWSIVALKISVFVSVTVCAKKESV